MKIVSITGLIMLLLWASLFHACSPQNHSKEDQQVLIQALQDKNPDVCKAAVSALININRASVVAPRIDGLTQHPIGSQARHMVVESIINSQAETREVYLLKTLGKSLQLDALDVFKASSQILAAIKSEAAIKPLINALASQSKTISYYAGLALKAKGRDIKILSNNAPGRN